MTRSTYGLKREAVLGARERNPLGLQDYHIDFSPSVENLDVWHNVDPLPSILCSNQLLSGTGKTSYWWKKWTPERGEKWAAVPFFEPIYDEDAIAARFVSSRQALLDLDDDWDGEGSPGYSDADWNHVEAFLIRHSKWLLVGRGMELPAPNILPGGDGTIDLHWKEQEFEILINVPRTGGTASFYGDDYRAETIKGTFCVDTTNTGLMEWIGSRLELATRVHP